VHRGAAAHLADLARVARQRRVRRPRRKAQVPHGHAAGCGAAGGQVRPRRVHRHAVDLPLGLLRATGATVGLLLIAARAWNLPATYQPATCRPASCALQARLWASCSLPVPGPASHPPAGHLQQAAARRPGERTDGEAAGAETVRVKLQTALRQGVSVSDRRSRSRSARTVKPRTGGQPVMPQLWGERCAGAAPPCRRSQTSRPPARASADT